jgi:hypothetical protein
MAIDGSSKKWAGRSEVLSVQSKFEASALVASATSLTLPTMEQRADIKIEGWQKTAWGWYDAVGEFRYACDWVGNILSKARLIVTDENGKPTTNPVAQEALDTLYGGADGQSEMFRMFGIHFSVAGETYLICADDTGEDDWMVAAASETTFDLANRTWRVDGETFVQPMAVRVWRPHPRRRRYSNSPARAALGILAELNGLAQRRAAQIDSRLAGAGILLVPSEISFAATTSQDAEGNTVKGEATSADDLVKLLMKTMATSLKDRGNAASLVPIVLQVAGEFVDKIKHLTMWSELDEHAAEQRKDATSQLALAMDMPPEVLEGQADLNHWSSWQVEEAAIKSHTEPLLAVITQSLTTGYLVPYLIANGVDPDEARKIKFGADTAAMRLRPNRSQESLELWDRGIIGTETVIRENGFDVDTDRMKEDELKVWFLRKVAQGSTTPELVQAALKALEVPMPEIEATVVEDETQEARPTRSLADHPDQGPPSTAEQNDRELAAAGGVIVFRALERVGNKLRNNLGLKFSGVAADATYLFAAEVEQDKLKELLSGEMAELCQRFASSYGAKPEELAEKLEAFTLDLLVKRRPFEQAALREHLRAA